MNYCKINQRQVNKQIKCEQAVIAKNTGSSLRLVDAMEDRTEISDVLMTIRQSLTDEEYELVDQYCIKKYPIGEIADRLNVSETVVRVRICRIRKKLGKYFP